MKLRPGGNPACAEDWSEPRRVVRRDGSDLCEAGKVISLDMTCFKIQGEYYVIWSQRQFLPVDQGAWLYIARLDPDNPWQLLSDPVVICKPEYGWENNHVFVVEGAYALITNEKLFVTYSGALVDATYSVGLLVAEKDEDLLDPESWTKINYPLLTSSSIPGEYGLAIIPMLLMKRVLSGMLIMPGQELMAPEVQAFAGYILILMAIQDWICPRRRI